MNKSIIACVLAASAALSFPAMAGDAAAGKSKAVVCASCHGMNGVSMIPTYPNLAGQKEEYLALSIKAYRDGLRNSAGAQVMKAMAAGLTDEDIANLAAYYNSL